MTSSKFNRRRMLIGTGASLSIPLLASMRAVGAGRPLARTPAPKRLVFLNFGYGTSKSWYPTSTGRDYELPKALQPLARHREDFSVLGNLTNVSSASGNPHWGATTFLTSADTARTPGREFHNAISCDQVAAQHLGKSVRFASLELTGPPGTTKGAGPGASLAWDTLGNPIQGEFDHVTLFQRLFGGKGITVDERRRVLESRQSVLDVVRLDAKAVARGLDAEDRDKLEEYFSLIRGIEGRLERDQAWLDRPLPETKLQQPSRGLNGTQDIHMMFDLMIAALLTDSTRVITYRMPTTTLLGEWSKETGKTTNAHQMTHYGSQNTAAYHALAWRDRKLSELFGDFLDKLKAARDVDGQSLLANTLVVMGTGIRTAHIRQNLPILVAGHGGGRLRHGSHYLYSPSETKLSNLWLSMLRHVGCPVDAFADSDGELTDLFG